MADSWFEKEIFNREFLNQIMEFIGPSEAQAMYAGPSATGWSEQEQAGQTFEGIYDKKPRFEISDKSSRLTGYRPDGQTYQYKLGDLLDHPELYSQYPELKDVDVDLNLSKPGGLQLEPGASFNPKTGKIEVRAEDLDTARSSLLHEIQHWIQNKEGFAPGGNIMSGFGTALEVSSKKRMLDFITGRNENALEFARRGRLQYEHQRQFDPNKTPEYLYDKLSDDILKSSRVSGNAQWTRSPSDIAIEIQKSVALQKVLDEYLGKIKTRKKSSEYADPSDYYNESYGDYRNVAGEIEAWDTADRMNLSGRERSMLSPYSSQGISPEDALVLWEYVK